MTILRCFKLTPDDYTLLCECAKGLLHEPVLPERTLLYALRDKGYVRFSEHLHTWMLTEFGETAVQAIELLSAHDPQMGPAKVIQMPR